MTRKILYFAISALLVGFLTGYSAVAYSPEMEGVRTEKITYRVRKGDCLYAIAKKFNLWAYDIAKANDISLYGVLQPEQELSIPVIKREAKRGAASWYGDDFNGKPMAHGGTFDPTKVSAAHRTFPPGTEVLVTVEGTNKSLVVPITDTGPFYRWDPVKKKVIVDDVGPFEEKDHLYLRDIDLSQEAARQLGFEGTGVVYVTIQPITKPIPQDDNIEITISYEQAEEKTQT